MKSLSIHAGFVVGNLFVVLNAWVGVVLSNSFLCAFDRRVDLFSEESEFQLGVRGE